MTERHNWKGLSRNRCSNSQSRFRWLWWYLFAREEYDDGVFKWQGENNGNFRWRRLASYGWLGENGWWRYKHETDILNKLDQIKSTTNAFLILLYWISVIYRVCNSIWKDQGNYHYIRRWEYRASSNRRCYQRRNSVSQ